MPCDAAATGSGAERHRPAAAAAAAGATARRSAAAHLTPLPRACSGGVPAAAPLDRREGITVAHRRHHPAVYSGRSRRHRPPHGRRGGLLGGSRRPPRPRGSRPARGAARDRRRSRGRRRCGDRPCGGGPHHRGQRPPAAPARRPRGAAHAVAGRCPPPRGVRGCLGGGERKRPTDARVASRHGRQRRRSTTGRGHAAWGGGSRGGRRGPRARPTRVRRPANGCRRGGRVACRHLARRRRSAHLQVTAVGAGAASLPTPHAAVGPCWIHTVSKQHNTHTLILAILPKICIALALPSASVGSMH